VTTPTTVKVQLKLRQDTSSGWSAVNPILLAGELGRESNTGKIKIGDGSTAWNSLAYQPFGALITNADISATAEIAVSKLADGAARQLLQTDTAGTGVEWTSNVDVPGTLDVTGAATFDAAVTIAGDLTVNGTTTNINTTNLVVEDKNIILGDVATPTDTTADGGGITLKGATDKTINWVDATDAWTLSENVNIASGKEYRIDGVKVLDATSLGSSVLITSANITDGTIVNGDVSASAAIAGTKISPDFGSQNVTTTGTATAAALIPTGSTVPVNGVYLSAANSVSIATNSTQRLLIDAAGQIEAVSLGSAAAPTFSWTGDPNTGIYSPGADQVAISTNGSQRLLIDSTGQIEAAGLGSASAPAWSYVGDPNTGIFSPTADTLAITTGGSERARIDSSGRLLVGTSTGFGNSTFTKAEFVNSASYANIVVGRTDGAAGSGSTIGVISFLSNAGGTGEYHASIAAEMDAASGSGDKPGRLVFSTTADGASSPTERMRIDRDGGVTIATVAFPNPASSTDLGIGFGGSSAPGYGVFSRSDSNALNICRQNSDGDLVVFWQGGSGEGSISVSGTTVSYNGAHLSRWSQLPGGAEREKILRGTVLSNVGEMCAWGEEENEQLNRMKVSNVEGDRNVSGVFQAWDDDDDTYTHDFYCAMTGDFIIRIAEGVTVQRGDLLMSAGDGTAKPQDDDIIRSKTVAKVTSTHVTCTYDDGSYCVPCVLMAC
jgi:hypothetical protein